jgi:hypothetical protein
MRYIPEDDEYPQDVLSTRPKRRSSYHFFSRFHQISTVNDNVQLVQDQLAESKKMGLAVVLQAHTLDVILLGICRFP